MNPLRTVKYRDVPSGAIICQPPKAGQERRPLLMTTLAPHMHAIDLTDGAFVPFAAWDVVEVLEEPRVR